MEHPDLTTAVEIRRRLAAKCERVEKLLADNSMEDLTAVRALLAEVRQHLALAIRAMKLLQEAESVERFKAVVLEALNEASPRLLKKVLQRLEQAEPTEER